MYEFFIIVKRVEIVLNAAELRDANFEIAGDADPVCSCGSDLRSVAYVNDADQKEPIVTCANCKHHWFVRSRPVVTVTKPEEAKCGTSERLRVWCDCAECVAFQAKQTKVVVFRFDAGNDANGNPRRVFVVLAAETTPAYESGDALAYIDEGYGGDSEVRKRFPGYVGSFATYATTVSEYRNLVKTGKTLVRKGA